MKVPNKALNVIYMLHWRYLTTACHEFFTKMWMDFLEKIRMGHAHDCKF